MTDPNETSADDAEVSRPGPMAVARGPYPQLLEYQLLTPTAPLAPGAEIRVYPMPMGPIPGSKASAAPAAWAPDPTGRHQWRWWSGAAWTDHVADEGEAGEDPLDPA